MTKEEHPVVLIAFLYNRGDDFDMSIPWTQNVKLRMEIVEELVSRGESAVDTLTSALSIYAKEMRQSTAAELGISRTIQTEDEWKTIDHEIRLRLRGESEFGQGIWPNLCHGPALALLYIGKQTVEPLIKACKEKDWLVKLEAIRCLGLIKDKKALPVLRRIGAWWNLFESAEAKGLANDSAQMILGNISSFHENR